MNLERLNSLQISLARLDARLHAAVEQAQAEGLDPSDALQGLVISEQDAQRDLSHAPLSGFTTGDGAARADLSLLEPPLQDLADPFGLTPLDLDILLLALAPALDRRYERLYAYLQNDLTRRKPTVTLAMNVLGGDVASHFAVWERLQPSAPLRAGCLLRCEPPRDEQAPPFITHLITVPERVVAYLLGGADLDRRLADSVRVVEMPEDALWWSEQAQSIFDAGDGVIAALRGPSASALLDVAAAVCAERGQPLVAIDAGALSRLDLPMRDAWGVALREARLLDAALAVTNWDRALSEDDGPPAWLWSLLAATRQPVFLCGERRWEPRQRDRARRLLRVEVPLPGYEERLDRWQQAAQMQTAAVEAGCLPELAAQFKLSGARIANAVQTAADLALTQGTDIRREHLQAGARAHSRIRLGALASEITPRYTWDDLVLPGEPLEQMHEICARARFGTIVNEQWGFGRKIVRSPGISALFAGESGTGKTMATEVIANELGLQLFKIDLSTVVSKYIGETEKNLSAIFTEAQASNVILFFDEADALFGKRSEVRDAHDRYANIEVAYLLQQFETFEGIAILASNLRRNLDEAFTRRLDFVVDFPFPDEGQRLRIWQTHFPPEAPLAADVDLTRLAGDYRLTGGNIRNAAIAAAYLAAEGAGPITPEHIRRAIRREHQKMGRFVEQP